MYTWTLEHARMIWVLNDNCNNCFVGTHRDYLIHLGLIQQLRISSLLSIDAIRENRYLQQWYLLYVHQWWVGFKWKNVPQSWLRRRWISATDLLSQHYHDHSIFVRTVIMIAVFFRGRLSWSQCFCEDCYYHRSFFLKIATMVTVFCEDWYHDRSIN